MEKDLEIKVEEQKIYEFVFDDYFKVYNDELEPDVFYVILEQDEEDDIEICINDNDTVHFPEEGLRIDKYFISKECFESFKEMIKIAKEDKEIQ